MLALFAGTAQAGNVNDRLRQWGHRHADTFQALNRGAHEGHSGDLASLIDDTKALVHTITQKLP